MADHFLIRDQQLAAKLEASPGVAETLTYSEVKLKPFQSDTPFTPDYPRFANDEVAEDIGEAADFVGGKKGAIQVGLLLKNSGTVGTPPAIGTFLRACGLKEQIVHAITIGAISPGSAFVAGATYSATGGKTGIVETTRTGAGTLRYIVTSGGALAASDVVTVGADSATASGTDALYGVKYTPRSTGHETMTLQRGEKNDAGTASHDYLYRLAGALGNGAINLAALDAGRFKGDYQGVISFLGDGAFLSGYTYESTTPPVWNNSTVQLNAVAIQVSEFGLDFGNEVALEPDPTTVGGTDGFDYARIMKRTPIITLNPYRLKTSELDDLGLHGSGATMAFTLSYGTTPQLIEITAGACQLRGWSPADRAGRRVASLSLNVVRGTLMDDDFSIMFR
jgi:hypothetical protein